MEDINVTGEQFNALNSALKKVDGLTKALHSPIAMESVEVFNTLSRQREDAIFNIRTVLMEQGLPVPPLKCSIIIPS